MKKKRMALHWKIIIGLILGVIWAFIASMTGLSSFTQNWIAPFGTIFINVLKLIAVPLVLFSIISGIAGLGNASSLGKIGLKTLAWYLCTTVLAVSVGLLVVNFVGPGNKINQGTRIDNRIRYELWAEENEVEIKDNKCYSCMPEYKDRVDELAAKMSSEDINTAISGQVENMKESKKEGPLQPLVDMVPDNIVFSLSNNTLMLQIIFFAIFFGVCLTLLPENRTTTIKSLMNNLNDIFVEMVNVVMKAAPFFVFALLAGAVSDIAGDHPAKVLEIFKGLGWYSLVVLIGLSIILFLVYPTVVQLFTRSIKYKDFFRGIGPAQTLAFSTSSSAATLPVTMECVENNLKIDRKISSFVLPIGATVNMDGTSLYQAVAVVFLAQFHLIHLALPEQLTIVLLATLASIGSAAIPSAGLVMLIIVLQGVGLNPAWIAIIFPVDRILDMYRTVINISGDTAVSAIIAKSEGMLYFKKSDP